VYLKINNQTLHILQKMQSSSSDLAACAFYIATSLHKLSINALTLAIYHSIFTERWAAYRKILPKFRPQQVTFWKAVWK